MHFTQTYLLLLLTLNCLTSIQEPSIINLSNTALDMAISEDGSMIVIAYGATKDAEVFTKASDGFIFNESLPSSSGANNVAISASNSILLKIGIGNVNYYTRGGGGNYQSTQSSATSNAVLDTQICSTEEFMASSLGNNTFLLKKRDGGIFSDNMTESCSSGYPTKIGFSQDC